MSDFKNVGVKVEAFVQEPFLRLAAGIAREEHAEASVCKKECDRVAVDRVTAFDEGERRPDKSQGHAIVGTPLHSGTRIDDGHAFTVSGCYRVAIGMAGVALTAIVELRHAQAPRRRLSR